jgi:hypothetical protein
MRHACRFLPPQFGWDSADYIVEGGVRAAALEQVGKMLAE